MISRRAFLAASACLLAAPLAATAQAWPARPLRLIVPYGPGSSPDLLARIVGERLSRSLGQPVIVENKPGANGNIGTDAIAKAAPDGYTFGVSIGGPLVVNTLLFKSLPYDPVRDLAPLTLAVHQPNVVVVSPSVRVNTMKELIEAAKRNPGRFNYASPGIGTLSNLSMELVKINAGIDMVHIPYVSSSLAVTALLAGDIQLGALPATSVMPHVKSGKLIALAVTTPKRVTALPNLPTLIESGIPNAEGSAWVGFVAPAKVDAAIRDRLSRELARTLKEPELVSKLHAQYMVPVGSTPAEFAAFLQEELRRWAPVIRRSGIQPE